MILILAKLFLKIGKYVLCMLKINLVENKSINKELIKINSSTKLKFL